MYAAYQAHCAATGVAHPVNARTLNRRLIDGLGLKRDRRGGHLVPPFYSWCRPAGCGLRGAEGGEVDRPACRNAFRQAGVNRWVIIPVNVKDTPATRGPAAAPLERPASTARRLAAASLSPNTRRAYAGALTVSTPGSTRRDLDDATLALYLAELHDAGRAPASAALAVAAAGFRARARGPAAPGRPADSPRARRLPADRRRARPWPGAAVRRRGPRGRARPPAPGHAREAAASSPTRSPPSGGVSTR